VCVCLSSFPAITDCEEICREQELTVLKLDPLRFSKTVQISLYKPNKKINQTQDDGPKVLNTFAQTGHIRKMVKHIKIKHF
jgi:hypothetical protein